MSVFSTIRIYLTIVLTFLSVMLWGQTNLTFASVELNSVFPTDGRIVPGAVQNKTQMCFVKGSGSYYLERAISFVLGGSLQNADNQYIVEYTLVTDRNWLKANQAQITKQPSNEGRVTDRRELKFKFPDNFKGGEYKIRLRATNPPRVGEVGDGTTAYTFGFYLPNSTPLVLNNHKNITLCGNTPQEISVDRKDEGKYIWTRDGRVITGATGPSLKVEGAGLYGVRVDYGTCAANIAEGTIRVSSNAISDFKIEGGDARRDVSVTICPGNVQPLVASEKRADEFYTWKKGALVVQEGTGKYEYTPPANDPVGDYTVSMGQGSCVIESKKLSVRLKSDFTSEISVPDGSYMLIHGKEKLMKISTGATRPTYQWYKDDVLIQGATSPTYTTNEPGTYYAKITSGDECSVTKETVKRIVIQYPVTYHIETTQNFKACDVRAQIGIRAVVAKGATGDGESISRADWKYFNFKWFKNGTTDLNLEGTDITITKQEHGSGEFSVQVTKEASVLGEIKDSNSQKVEFSDATPVSIEVTNANGDRMEPAGEDSDKAGSIIKCANEELTISATVKESTANYKWYFRGNNGVDYFITEGTGLHDIKTLTKGTKLKEVKTSKDFEYNDSGVGTYWVVMREKGKSCDSTAEPIRVSSETFFAMWSGDPQEITDKEKEKRNLIIFYPKAEKKPELIIDIVPANIDVEITWVRNGVTIAGAVGRTYTVTETGRYYAQVKKIGGCAEPVTPYTKHVAEPDEYDLVVGYKENASPCGRKTATLELSELRAIAWRKNDKTGEDILNEDGTLQKVVNVVSPDEYNNYEFQWYKDGEQIPGAQGHEYEIKDTDKEKGIYRLNVLAKNSSNQVSKNSNDFEVLYIDMPKVEFSGKKTLEPNKEFRVLLNLEDKFRDVANYIYVWRKGTGKEAKVIKSSLTDSDKGELEERMNAAGYNWNELVQYKNKATEDNYSYVVENVGNLESTLYKNTLGTYEVIAYSRKHLGCESRATFTIREQDTTIGIIIDNGSDNSKEIVGKLDKGEVMRPAEDNQPKVIRVEVNLLKGEYERSAFVVKDPEADKFLLITKNGCSEMKSESGAAFALSYADAMGISSFTGYVSACGVSQLSPTFYTPTDDEFVFVYSLDANNNPITLFVLAIKSVTLSDIQNTVLLNSSNSNNRTLILPEEYLGAKVEIYAPNGEKVFGAESYRQRSWPNEAAKKYCGNKGSATIFHIIVTKDGKEKSGSITVLN